MNHFNEAIFTHMTATNAISKQQVAKKIFEWIEEAALNGKFSIKLPADTVSDNEIAYIKAMGYNVNEDQNKIIIDWLNG